MKITIIRDEIISKYIDLEENDHGYISLLRNWNDEPLNDILLKISRRFNEDLDTTSTNNLEEGKEAGFTDLSLKDL